MSDIYQFLELRRVEKGAEMSHTSMSKPKGSFMIKKNEMAKFFELYDKALQKGDDLCLIERHIDYGPMVIDLDFEYLPDVDERQHDEEHIRGVVKLYQEEVVNMFNLEPDDSKLTAYVFQKPAPYREKEKNSGDAEAGSTTGGNKYKRTKDGIHIIFPFIVSTPEPQYLIRENILKRIGTVLDVLPLVVPKGKEGNNSYTAVVDRSVIQANGWFLFGSTKPGHEKYELNYIYKHDMTCIDFDNVQDIPQDELASYFNNMTPTRFFSIRNKNEIDIVPVRDENMDAISRFRAAEHKKATKKKSMNEKMNPEEINLIKQFVQIMSDKRANEYNSWIEVGWALHNMGAENQDLLDIWIEFSKRSPKYVDGDCETRWESMKDEGLGIGSIRYWARLDNPDMYKKIIMNDINKMIEASIKTPTNFDIASVLHRMFRYDYKYSKDEGWYYFDNHLWRRNEDGMMLRSKISTDLCEKYAYMIRDNNKRMLEDNEMTDEEKEDIKARNKEILGIIAKLKTTSFKENIMKECKEIFYDIDFINKLDENFYLIGFTNGIYDLKRGELREGRPDDYVTLTTRIQKIDFSEEHEQWPELSKFIYTIFPDEEKREYFMTFLATCLQGLNAEEKFRVWTGSGCHAKDTRIMMSNGQWKMVQDIQVGDELMGDDSTVRNVLELKGGFSDMYRIYGNGFKEFIVNGDHVLCLKDIKHEIHEIKVVDYLKIDNLMKLYKVDGSEFGFEIEKVKDDHYYGFQLDGNHRYVMDDNIITHNSNGKSKLEELFTAAFGEYTIKFPITLLTGKRAASNACSPELVKAKGKRIGYFVEPSEGERVNAGLMKEFTGGDKIYARGLNKDPIEFKPQFKLSLLCNDVPHFPPKDTGVWRRVEIVEFSSKFVEKPNPEDPNQFPIDNKITEKIQQWKELFMAYLTDVYYAKYKVEGIKVPESVLRFTIEFQKMFDMYSEFIDNVIVETGIETDVTTLSELHEEFKNWYLETFNNPKIPTKHEFRQYMEKTYGKKRVTSSEIKGIKSKMKIEEEKKKKEAEERAKLGIVDDDDDMREVMDDEDLEALGVVPLTPEELARLEEEEMDFGEDELFDNEEFNKKYRNPDGTLKTPPKLKSISSCNMNGPPMIRSNNGSGENTHVTTRNNEYNITSLDQLKSLNIPGMENIDDNPVLKAIFSRDMNQIRNLQYLDMKQTGPNTYALPETTLPPVKTVETFEDENGNRTTTTTITNTRNIPVVKFEGLPPGFRWNPFALIAAKRPPPPPPHHIVAAMMASMLARREMEEEERERRRKNGEPEPPMSPEDDMDLPPDHPMFLAFAAMMKNVIEHDIEEKVRNDPTVPPEQVQDRVERIMKHIFEDDDDEEFEQMMRQREIDMKKMEEEKMGEKKVIVEEEKKEDEDEVKIEEVEQVVQEKKSVKRGRKPKNQSE
jgi:P4 family phage/plasmid primase-like protien